jgi:hypothetical protein
VLEGVGTDHFEHISARLSSRFTSWLSAKASNSLVSCLVTGGGLISELAAKPSAMRVTLSVCVWPVRVPKFRSPLTKIGVESLLIFDEIQCRR